MPLKSKIALGNKDIPWLRNRISYMFDNLNKKTIDCLVEGSICLASIWSSAWHKGNGSDISDNLLVEVDKSHLQELYMDRDFLPAYRLNDPIFKELLQA